MNSATRDYSVFDRLNLEKKPVGVKFLAVKPEGIQRIKKGIALCEMCKEAQTSQPFYVQEEDFICVEPLVLGMKDADPALVSGMAGGGALYKEARANRKIYQYVPKMLKGSVNYVVFSAVDQLTFDPDVMVFTATPGQARLLLRSLDYTTGDMWTAKGTAVLACAWMYVYPVLSGQLNFTVTGLSMGMYALNVYPEGLFLVSVPWNLLPTMMENLADDNLFRDFRAPSREAHYEGFNRRLAELRAQIAAK